MPPHHGTPHSTRADVDARIGETFVALNQIAASLALVERSCSRVVDVLPVGDDAALEHALVLRAAIVQARLALEQIGDVSDTLATVLRFISRQKTPTTNDSLSLPGESCGGA